MGGGAVSREGGRLSVRASIPRTVLMALGSALLAACSGVLCVTWFVTLPEQAAEISLVMLVVARLVTLPIFAAGVAGVLLFGPGVVFFLGRLVFFWRPVFEMGPEGILDRASAVGVGFVPWGEVREAGFRTVGGQRFLAFRVEDERALLVRLNPIKRLLIKTNRRYFTGAQINVPLNALSMSEEDLAAEISRCPGLPREVAERFRPGTGRPTGRTARGGSPPGTTPVRSALRVAASVVRWAAVLTLSLFYYTVSGLLVVFGGACVWNGLGPGDASELDYPVAGAIMLTAGILVFVFFPRVVKKLTGREVLTSPYGGFWGGS